MNLFPLGVLPLVFSPLQVLIAILPALLLSLAGLIVSLFKPATMWALLKLLWRQKIALTIMAAVVTGTVFLVRSVSATGGATTGQVAGTDWPMFRGGLDRRGSNDPHSPPPTAGGINWSYSADVKKFFASPAVVGNRVYVTSADKEVFNDRGAVYCLDADTGELDWKSAPKGFLATFSSPSIMGKYLVCGEGLHETKTARVVCMDVTQRGKILWTYQTRSHVESTPCIANNRVYVGAGDDGYYCFQLEPGADGKAQLVWHAPAKRCPDAETSPAVHDGLMFAGLGIGGKAVVCLNADTGEEVWRAETPYPVFGPPTVVTGSVIVAMGNGDFVNTAEEVRSRELARLRESGRSAEEIAAAAQNLGAAGEIWCLNAKTGAIRWTFRVPDTVLGAVAAADERLFFGCRDGHVYCLSPAGKLLVKWNARAPILTSPAVSGGHVYVVTQEGNLFGLRADDLERVWEARLSFTGPFISSPAVARGHVYVGSQQDGLLCLGMPGSGQREIRWDGFAGGPGRGGNVDGQPLPERGRFGWRFPEGEDTASGTNLVVAAPPACLNGVVYVPADGARKGLLCVRDVAEKGEARGAEVWFAATPNGVRLSPAATPSDVFFVDGGKGDSGRSLRAVSAADGRENWRLPVEEDAPGDFVLTDEGGLIADGAQRLTAFDAAGRVIWQTECGAVCGMPAVSDALVAVATESPAGVAVLDRLSGRKLWRIPLDAAPAAGPVVRKNTIYLATSAGIEALRLVDGSRLWREKTAPVSTPLVLAGNRLACTTRDGEGVIVQIEDGREAKTIPDMTPGIPPLAVMDLFVFAGKKGLIVCPVDSDEQESWMNTAWLGRPTCAPVMAASRIFLGTDKKGLVCLKSK